jgi:type II secretory ATPase GspE/PulE/Tfp pilus assembly ATPase PilB-like protein
VVAQRLVRRICTHCKVPYEPAPAVLDGLFFNRGDAKVHFHRGRGCEACHDSGYAGRMAIHEIFVVTDSIRDMIVRRAPITQIQREAERNGFRSMRYDGVMKVLQGLTTIEEVDQMTRVVLQA